MPHNLQNVDFSCNPLNIVYIYDFVFLQYLNCDFLSRETMGSYHDLSECTFSKISPQHIVTDYLALFLILFWRCLDF